VSGDAFWEFERDGWERAAEYYEACWGDTSSFVTALLDAAEVKSGTRVLDVACGPGYVSQAAYARGAEPVGLDVATAMVETARRRSPDLTFVVGDAQQLPFPDGSFDAVTMNFGILHLSEPERALTEARRVLVPGCRFAFSAWVAEGNAVAEIVDGAVAAHAVPVELPQGPDFYRFADDEQCRLALGEAGFDVASTVIETVESLWCIPQADALFDAELQAGVRTAAVLRGQPPERLEAIREAIAEGVRRYADGQGFSLPLVARVISARSAP
jgi:SAM-dependent methyltransferase